MKVADWLQICFTLDILQLELRPYLTILQLVVVLYIAYQFLEQIPRLATLKQVPSAPFLVIVAAFSATLIWCYVLLTKLVF